MLCMQTQRIMSHTWSQNTVRAAMPRGYVACSEPKKKKGKKGKKRDEKGMGCRVRAVEMSCSRPQGAGCRVRGPHAGRLTSGLCVHVCECVLGAEAVCVRGHPSF